MLISKLEPQSACALFVRNEQGRSVQLETSVLSIVDKETILLEPYRYNGKLINLSGTACALEIVVEGRFYSFELDSIAITRKAEGPAYIAKCTTEGRAKNRRSAVRVPLGCNTAFSVNGNPISGCYVYDLSSTGIAVTVPKGVSIAKGDSASAGFKYKWGDDIYKVTGRVVRIELLEKSDYIRVGVEFNEVYASIDSLVAEIQRDMVAQHKKDLLRRKF